MVLIGLVTKAPREYEGMFAIYFQEYQGLEGGSKTPKNLNKEIHEQIRDANIIPDRAYMFKWVYNNFEEAYTMLNDLMENDIKNSLENLCVELSITDPFAPQDLSTLT